MDSRLKKMGEFGLIRHLTKQLPPLPSSRWIAGFSDDTSVLRLSERHYQLLSTDLLIEKVHFILETPADYSDLGWKALAVNLSDIAAMGGVPQEAVVGLAVPAKASLKQLESIYRGLRECSEAYHCPIVGGDTNRSRSGWLLSVTVTGFCSRRPKLRHGTRPGDSLWVSGTLGAAALGWQARKNKKMGRALAGFRKKWSRPQARIVWGQRLGECSDVSAMMDVSDGLAGDVQHLASVNQLGFKVQVDQLPQALGFAKQCLSLKLKPEKLMLSGGEDYELLFTVQKGKHELFQQWLEENGVCATRIGEAVSEKSISFWQQGQLMKNQMGGFRHF